MVLRGVVMAYWLVFIGEGVVFSVLVLGFPGFSVVLLWIHLSNAMYAPLRGFRMYGGGIGAL